MPVNKKIKIDQTIIGINGIACDSDSVKAVHSVTPTPKISIKSEKVAAILETKSNVIKLRDSTEENGFNLNFLG